MLRFFLGFQMSMPGVIERSVRRQNIQFMHNKTQFSVEYFQFIRKLVMSNVAVFQNVNSFHFSKVRTKISELSSSFKWLCVKKRNCSVCHLDLF